MRNLVIGDLHFGTKTNNTQWIEHHINYFNNQLINEIKTNHYDRIIFLGDLTDIRHAINQHVGCELKNCIRKLSIEYSKSNSIGKIIFVAGNHDYYSPLREFEKYNSYELLFGEEFTQVYSNITFVNNIPFYDLADNALYLPWFYTEDQDLLISKLKEIKSKFNVETLYCHADLITWDDNIKNILGSTQVYSGHIHHYWEEGNLHNLCAALPLNFNDVNEKRYIHVIDDGVITKRIENITTPLFKRIYNEQIFEEIQVSFFENSFVQLFIDKQNINKANYIERIKEIKKEYGEQYSISVKLYENINEIEKMEFAPIQTNINEFIKTNVPDHLNDKYIMIKEQIENKHNEDLI
jgi:hypothetical protein